MHDSLGHELSLLALRAGVLQVAPDLPERHRAAAADLRAAAADATDRLHRIIGVLREDADEPLPLAPAGETVGQLVARAAESGLPVRCETGGRPVEPGGVAERLLYRVAREALTNAARHAPGAPVVVQLTGGPGATVTVVNGPATQPSSAPSGGGSGLRGLRAAVTAVGGTFEAGPHGDGYRVRARVPERAAGHPAPSRAPSAPFTRARRRVATALGAAAGAGVALVAAAGRLVRVHRDARGAGTRRLRRPPPRHAAHRPGPARPAGPGPALPTAPPPRPRGADCRYYRASGELFVSVDHYRLCFDDKGRLTAKDVVPRVGGQQAPVHEEFTR